MIQNVKKVFLNHEMERNIDTDSKIYNFITLFSNNRLYLTDYSFLPNSLVSMLTYFSVSSTDEGYIPIFSYTKLALVDLRPNNKFVFSRTAQ